MGNVVEFRRKAEPEEEEVFDQNTINRVINYVKWRPNSTGQDIADYLDMSLTDVLYILLVLVQRGNLRMIQHA